MSNDKKIEVVVANGHTYVTNAPSHAKIFTTGNKKISSEENGHIKKYDHVFSPGDKIIHRLNEVKSTVYQIKEKGNSKLTSEIDEELYKKLPDALKSLYRKVETKKSRDVVIDQEVEITNLHDYVRANPVLVILERNEVIQKLVQMSCKINKRVRVVGSLRTTYSDGYVGVIIMVSDYNGEKRKVLEKKANGQPYANRRGYFVDDYPQTLAKYKISDIYIPELSASSEEEMQEKLQKLYDHITMSHMAQETGE